MRLLDEFGDITRQNEPLAPYTWLKIGGPARFFVEPRSRDELIDVVRHCHAEGIAVRVLGGGSNLLVPDEGVSGVVLFLSAEAFSRITIDETAVQCCAGAALSRLISCTVKAGLAGLEVLAGIPGTVGGALHGNAGGRSGDIGQYVGQVNVLTALGEQFTRTEDELSFAYRSSSINELVILDATFQLQHDDPHEIVQRMRKIWIMKKATQPLTLQSAGCVFKNPRGLSAGALIEQAGLKGLRVGNASVCDRHANFVVTGEGATAADVSRLIDLVRSKVSEQFGVDLELEIGIW